MRGRELAALGWLAACAGPDSLELLPESDPFTTACDVVAQDCDGGQKCGFDHSTFEVPVWYASPEIAVAVGPAQCVEERGDAELHEACTVDGDGLDDCASGLTCLTVDAARSEGTCVALCQPGAQTCGDVGLPDHQCRTGHIEAPGVCLMDCLAMVTGCDDGFTCQSWYAYPRELDTACVPPGEGEPGEACGDQYCGDELTCYDGRCTSYCEVDKPRKCESGQCVAFTSEDSEGYGVCYTPADEEG